ncbi:hypothetical protein H0H81_001034 [Sphagnurus paluster]|uniref:DUF6589 domain-containing protein n=1 Tax=Sphagnurus paluster TaxID=117069 RepID=A0A9P7GHZ3_9AGAR|nr:hypothetical protein H0H81_001034 [Sphagnurus paluster]
MGFTTISENICALTDHSITDARRLVVTAPTGMAYDNINITSSIFVEQVPGAMNKVQNYTKKAEFENPPCRKLPDGHKTEFHPLRATTIEEASVQGNLLNHKDIMVVQLQRSDEDLDKYLIPTINDQLTNPQNRAVQVLHSKDLTPWSRREVLALGFGTFHLVMNLIWMLLHHHQGSIDQIGSLTHLFAVLEKVRLSGEHPDFHALLSGLTQILDGLILNAWQRECGYDDLQDFSALNPSPAKILEIAKTIIIDKYGTPFENLQPCEKKRPADNTKEMDAHQAGEAVEESDSEDTIGNDDSPAPNVKDPTRENLV